ncbi:GGDEF domain-containing protein [Vibrio sp. MACH09]|uniref:bifunctional diguanylate cyclase/phosphodiesterase n=1 Tax=Vibrio sp. MACH09 TaxID=3025122 RepID=UPI00278D41D9|nr:EAL domain-containing protein [Vibrio sp. MACH09]GLO60066.1 GGDEF domain-containing protein [Vibrio sp. MACH09]
MVIKKIKVGIQGRFIVVNIVLVTIIITVISIVQLYNFNTTSQKVLELSTKDTRASLLKQAYKRGNSILDYISESVVNPFYQYDLDATYNLLQPALTKEEVISIVVFDESGATFHDGEETIPSYGEKLQDEDLLTSVIDNKRVYTSINSQYLIMAKPIFIDTDLLGGVVLTLSLEPIYQDMNKITSHITETNQSGLQKITIAIGITALLFCVGGIFISILISRSLVSPIHDLVSHTKSIVKGDFETENKIDRDDEMGELAEAFNEMGRSLKVQTDEISFLAYHDSLTKLPNRALFIKQLTQLISRKAVNERFSVLFLDLDEFKFVNDNYGHKAGDELLCEVATRITDNLRVNDFIVSGTSFLSKYELVARIGGDEFLICLPDISDDICTAKIATRLIDAIQVPITLDKEEVVISGSIGIANFPEDGSTAEELIKNADIAMYQAKSMGKNIYANFDQKLNVQIKARMVIEQDLRRAMDDLSQFELWYQPQFSVETSELVGAEALIRWRHPTKGLIYPNEFIPVAEECGVIISLGEWVIDTACRQLKIWQAHYSEDFYISVNLSARQIYRSNPVELFSAILSKHQILPNRLHVEVTESILMKDESLAKSTLADIRSLGIQLWLDDFGTGYSSLSYLRTFEFDGVKIDRSFVSDIEIDNFDRALTSAVINMAKSLNISVVAEGVETQFQLDFLAENQCDVAQGYFYSKPVPSDEFETNFLDINYYNQFLKSNG